MKVNTVDFTQKWLDRKWVKVTQKWLDQKWVNSSCNDLILARYTDWDSS
jgi:hypothetical protein